MKHTPAPWRFTAGNLPRVMTQDGIKSVCGIHKIGKFSNGGRMSDEVIANGHLIAAAPELLEALLYIRHRDAMWLDNEIFNAALKKAKGE